MTKTSEEGNMDLPTPCKSAFHWLLDLASINVTPRQDSKAYNAPELEYKFR